jgi:hypothetical protein
MSPIQKRRVVPPGVLLSFQGQSLYIGYSQIQILPNSSPAVHKYKKSKPVHNSNHHTMSSEDRAPEENDPVHSIKLNDPFATDRVNYARRPTNIAELNRSNNNPRYKDMVYPWIDPSPEFESRLQAAALIINDGAESARNLSSPALREQVMNARIAKLGLRFCITGIILRFRGRT